MMDSKELVDLVTKGQSLADIEVFEAGGEEFVSVPSGVNVKRVKEWTTPLGFDKTCSNAEALFDIVIEEARRRENTNGSFMTVVFNGRGAAFTPDDKNRFNPDRWTYNRRESQELHFLRNAISPEALSHADLLKRMSAMSFIIPDYREIYTAMRRVVIDKKATFTSQPKIVDGKNGAEFAFAFQIEGKGTGKATFPAEFNVSIPMTPMSQAHYTIQVEVEAWADDKGFYFALRAPTLEAVKSLSVLEEYRTFRGKIREHLPALLVVCDL